MRISDWSSDVCSSDLLHARGADTLVPELAGALIGSLGFGRLPISLDGSLEEHGRLLLVAKVGVGAAAGPVAVAHGLHRSEEHTSELQSLMRISYAVFCLKQKKTKSTPKQHQPTSDIN